MNRFVDATVTASKRGAVIGALAAASIAMGVLITIDGVVALSASLAILLVGVLWGADILKPRTRTPESYTRWVPVAWLALFLVSNHSFENRSPLAAAQGSASGRTMIELAVYGVIVMAVIMRWSVTPLGFPSVKGWLILSAWPAFALYSTFWSVISLFTLVRSAQLFVPIMLAVYVARLWKTWPELGREIWLKTLGLLIRATTLLTVIGFAFAPVWLGEAGGGRFAWPGVHPVEGGILLGLVLIIVSVGGRELTQSTKLVHVTRVVLLGVALVLTQTRGALVSLVAAGLIALWFSGRRQLLFRYLGLPLLVAGGWVLWALTRTQLIEYSLRGGGTDDITTFNGRIPLWELSLDIVHSAGRDLMGFGYGAPRVLLFEKVEWAGSAHNAWIEWFVGIGLIGVALAAISYLFIGARLIRVLRVDSGRINVAVLSLFVFLIVSSIGAELTALPGFGFSLFLMVAIFAIVESERVATVPVANRLFAAKGALTSS
jgi:exopolysaccharide production protein ExoQ